MVSLSDSYQPTVVELAREGDFRAIAYWLNEALIPQEIYARVEAAAKPGCLQILVEFQQQPSRDRLIRLICHRLWQLNSQIIEGAVIIARHVGSSNVLWKQAVRILTPANRVSPNQQPLHPGLPRSPRSIAHSQTARSQVARPQVARPQASNHLKSRSQSAPARPRPTRAAIAAHSRPTPKRSALKPRQLVTPRQNVSWNQFKTLNPLFLGGSAVAAFVIGCWVEALTYGTTAADSYQSEIGATPITEPSPPPSTVQAALETVPVIRHNAIPKPEDPAITLMFSGNVALDDFTGWVGQNANRVFASMKEFRQVDVAMVNLDSPVLNAMPDDQEPLQVLVEGGVDIVNLANNRTVTSGEMGLIETIQNLNREGIHHVGAGHNVEAARRPEVLEVKGQRIAYLSYSDPNRHVASERVAGLSPRQNDQIAEDIQAIRDQVDWIVVNYHWSEDLTETPAKWQVDLAHFAVDQGADVVVGYHPQILQGAEIYKGRPIAYSLGNFIFNGNSSYRENNYDTAVLKVSLNNRQMKVEYLPVVVRASQPRVVKGDRAKEILQKIEQASTEFEQPMRSPVVLEALPSPVKVEEPAPTEVLEVSPADSEPVDPSAPFTTDSEAFPIEGEGLQDQWKEDLREENLDQEKPSSRDGFPTNPLEDSRFEDSGSNQSGWEQQDLPEDSLPEDRLRQDSPSFEDYQQWQDGGQKEESSENSFPGNSLEQNPPSFAEPGNEPDSSEQWQNWDQEAIPEDRLPEEESLEEDALEDSLKEDNPSLNDLQWQDEEDSFREPLQQNLPSRLEDPAPAEHPSNLPTEPILRQQSDPSTTRPKNVMPFNQMAMRKS